MMVEGATVIDLDDPPLVNNRNPAQPLVLTYHRMVNGTSTLWLNNAVKL